MLALLGEGRMGQVHRARDQRLAREVALKVVHADLAQDEERLKRFEHEARAAGALNHPNIVAVYDTGQSDGSSYIVSELLAGETLRDRLATGSLGTRKSVEFAVQIARGLAAAHERGIVHRDLKPENLFLTRDGLVKILDFGIAKLGRPGEERAGSEAETLSHTGTIAGTMLGTVGYMSPEQVRGLPVDDRSDLFSFGAVLFEMLTGRRAFKGATTADTLSAILHEDPTEAIGTGTALPAGLLRVVRRCLEKGPEDRFQTARDLAFALEGVSLAKIGRPVSPDGRRVVASDPDGVPALYLLEGGERSPIPGLGELDVALCWTPDGRALFVARYEDTPPRIERIDVATGATKPRSGMPRTAPIGLRGDLRVLVTPDGESYAYGYSRVISDLYLVSNLR